MFDGHRTEPTSALPPPAEARWRPAARRAAVLLLLGVAWQAYALWVANDLIFPTLTDTLAAFWHLTATGELPARTLASFEVLALGYGAGLGLATLLVLFAVASAFGSELLATLTAMFNPLPAIALLPLALLWFGLGTPSLVFVITHSVLWAVALNTHAGVRAIPPTLRRVGENLGLRGWRLTLRILLPAALPAVIAGLRIGWAFAWRTLIAAELVFGTSSRSGGLGWLVFERRNNLQIDEVFAALLAVILIGLLIEGVAFRALEKRTLGRWGMHR